MAFTCSAKYTLFPQLPQLGLPLPNCLPVVIDVIGEPIRPLKAAPYRVPVELGPNGIGIRALIMGVSSAGFETIDGFFSGLGVRGGPVIADSRGTVRGKPLGPLPACDGVTAIVGGSQSSVSPLSPSLDSDDSISSAGGLGVFEGPLNEVRFGLQLWVGLNMGVGEPVRAPLYRLRGGDLRAGNGGALLAGEFGADGRDVVARAGEFNGERSTSSRSGRLAWRRSRVPKFLT